MRTVHPGTGFLLDLLCVHGSPGHPLELLFGVIGGHVFGLRELHALRHNRPFVVQVVLTGTHGGREKISDVVVAIRSCEISHAYNIDNKRVNCRGVAYYARFSVSRRFFHSPIEERLRPGSRGS